MSRWIWAKKASANSKKTINAFENLFILTLRRGLPWPADSCCRRAQAHPPPSRPVRHGDWQNGEIPQNALKPLTLQLTGGDAQARDHVQSCFANSPGEARNARGSTVRKGVLPSASS